MPLPPLGAPVRGMSKHMEAGLRAAGMWIALGALLFVVGLGTHPREVPDTAEQMGIIAGNAMMMRVSHWAIALGSVMFAAASVMVLATGSRLTATWGRMTCWSGLAVVWLLFTVVPVIEATVATNAAVAADAGTYGAWHAFVMGMVNTMVLAGIATAVLAWIDMRSNNHVTPKWAAGVGCLSGVVLALSFVGSSWFGVEAMRVLFFASFPFMAWWGWFGLGMMRPTGWTKLASSGVTA